MKLYSSDYCIIKDKRTKSFKLDSGARHMISDGSPVRLRLAYFVIIVPEFVRFSLWICYENCVIVPCPICPYVLGSVATFMLSCGFNLRMASKLHQLQTKAVQASQFVAKHGTSYYKQLLEQNKQYIVQPPTVEKCQELSKQLFYTRLASLSYLSLVLKTSLEPRGARISCVAQGCRVSRVARARMAGRHGRGWVTGEFDCQMAGQCGRRGLANSMVELRDDVDYTGLRATAEAREPA
ncbi:hypothetical protein IEQ34_018683 [Dendrobium chrysotoxum]|uniref:Uncharacterized protein n=1 Tax=Dendrobium chrysotoxum TaxID=161865 RepID=A0AAV7G6T9_DENCH|nr:hypothetical protein IEQ34_018683 [Dendrobium chrysotoxum]